MTKERWYAGVDWASESHHVFLTDGNGHKIGEKIFKHSREGLAEMAAWLLLTMCNERADADDRDAEHRWPGDIPGQQVVDGVGGMFADAGEHLGKRRYQATVRAA